MQRRIDVNVSLDKVRCVGVGFACVSLIVGLGARDARVQRCFL